MGYPGDVMGVHIVSLPRHDGLFVDMVNEGTDDELDGAPNDTAYNQWSCHGDYKLPFKLCRNLQPPAMEAELQFFVFKFFWGKPAMQT